MTSKNYSDGPKLLIDPEILEQKEMVPWELIHESAIAMALELEGPVVIQLICGQACCFAYDQDDAPFMANLEADFVVRELRPARAVRRAA